MTKPPYEWDDLINKDFSYHTVEIKERPGEYWIQLQEGIDLDKYVWRFTDIQLNDENLLEFSVECINSLEGVPDEIYPYAASMIMKSLQEVISGNK